MGIVGEYKTSVQKALKLPKFSAGFELLLADIRLTGSRHYRALPRYPKVMQDICLRVPTGVSYHQLHDFVRDALSASQPAGTYTELTPLDIYQRPDDTEHKQITFHYTTASYERTMTDGEVVTMLNDAASAAAKTFGAERV